MTPRRRTSKNRGLPAHVYTERKGDRTYYRYRNPQTGKFHGLGPNKALALQAANLLNSRLVSTPTAESLVARVLSAKDPFDEYAQNYTSNTLPRKKNRRGQSIASKTLTEYKRYIARAIAAWGTTPIAQITRRHVAEFLDQFPDATYNRTRNALRGLFADAVAGGVIDANPVDGTAIRTEVVQRKRLTHDQYRAIHAVAEPWLQRAMDLALLTLQRREDLVRLTKNDVIDGALHVRVKKTGVNLRIRVWPELDDLLSRCPDGPLVSRQRSAVKPDYLSRAFEAARDQVPELAALAPGTRPSFHELRALGARLHEEAGRDPQGLLGHLERKTTRVYLDRHQEKWSEV